MSFADKCPHCEHAKEDVKCCFCNEYVHRSGTIVFHADVPIIIHNVDVEPENEYPQTTE